MVALLCKLILGPRDASRLVYPPDTYEGFFRLGLASAMLGDLKRAGLHFLHPTADLVSFTVNPWPLFPAVKLESALNHHLAANMT